MLHARQYLAVPSLSDYDKFHYGADDFDYDEFANEDETGGIRYCQYLILRKKGDKSLKRLLDKISKIKFVF